MPTHSHAAVAATPTFAASPASSASGAIHVGVGGWIFPAWRDNFYPKGLVQARELEYASRQLTAIEINATYYRLQSPDSFSRWHDQTPDGFVFSLKGSKYVTQRRVLGEAGEAIGRYFDSGVTRLKSKLGPIVWQFATTKTFEADDFAAFLRLLPRERDGLALRHAVEVRHASFRCAEFLDVARTAGVATVFADSDDYPSFADLTGNFVYARLMKTRPDEPVGYSAVEIARWAEACRAWSRGEDPVELPHVAAGVAADVSGSSVSRIPRDVFVFYISGAKERNPHAARATLERLGWTPPGS